MSTMDAWAIVDTRFGRQQIFYGTHRTRNEAIAELVWNYFGEKVEGRWPGNRSLKPKQRAEWVKLYRQGYRCLPVRVEIISAYT